MEVGPNPEKPVGVQLWLRKTGGRVAPPQLVGLFTCPSVARLLAGAYSSRINHQGRE
jgi:hypothetical protein